MRVIIKNIDFIKIWLKLKCSKIALEDSSILNEVFRQSMFRSAFYEGV